MTDLVIAYAPWKLTHHLLEDHVIQPWVVGYKPHPIRSDIWMYLDIDPASGGASPRANAWAAAL